MVSILLQYGQAITSAPGSAITGAPQAVQLNGFGILLSFV
jgi:hypothetical protein